MNETKKEKMNEKKYSEQSLNKNCKMRENG